MSRRTTSSGGLWSAVSSVSSQATTEMSFGNAEPEIADRGEETCEELVVAGDDRRGRIDEAQHLDDRPVAVLDGHLAWPAEQRIAVDPEPVELVDVGLDPDAAPSLRGRAGDQRDAPVPEAGEMSDGLAETCPVIGQDGVGSRARHIPVEKHRRLEGGDPFAEPIGGLVRRRDDQPVEPSLAEGGDELRLVIGVVRRVGDHQRIPARAESEVGSLRDRGEQWVGDVADDEADRPRRPGSHAPRGHVRPVAERHARRDHAIADLGTHERLIVERA